MNRAALRNIGWSAIEAGAAGALSFVSAFVVARVIGPSEFGIGTAAVAAHVMFWVAANGLFADALVQRRDLSDVMASSAFWAALILGILFGVGEAGLGLLIAGGLADARPIVMSLLLALPLPLVGIAGVAQGLLTRRSAYRALANRTIIGQGLGTLAGVIAAVSGGGAWSPVLQQTVTSTAGALTLLVGLGWRPRAVFRLASVLALLRVGAPLAISTLVLAARYRAFALVLAGVAGSATLGQTHLAFRTVDTVRELGATALWRLMLPVLSRYQDDRAALRAIVDRLGSFSSMATMPLCGAMALLASPLLARVLGPQWSEARAAAGPLIALMAVMFLMFPAGVAVIARGRIISPLVGHCAGLLLILAATEWLRPASALQAAMVWCAVQAAMTPYVLWINGRAIGTSPLRTLRTGLPMAGVTVVAVVVAMLLAACVAPAGSLPFVGWELLAFAVLVLAGGAVIWRLRLCPDSGTSEPLIMLPAALMPFRARGGTAGAVTRK